jgi:hypothetical protein
VGKVGESTERPSGSAASAPVAGKDAAGGREPLLGRTGRVLALLFPPDPPPRRGSRGMAAGVVLAYVAAIALGAFVLLERQSGHPAWSTVWAEDGWLFLPGALVHPGSSLWQAADGYLSLVPRIVADGVARFPLRAAAPLYAVTGAIIASACAAFVYRASAGHVRNSALRATLAASVLLLPTALKAGLPNNGVNAIWYLLFAAFWALLWRPRSRTGMAVAAVVCFAAATSNVLVALYLPLVVARVIALPRVREHAATIGWLAGGAVQLFEVLFHSRPHQPTSVLGALGFYGHNVILPAVAGYHFGQQLAAGLGIAGATAIAAFATAALIAWVLVRGGAGVRAFAVTALVLGLVLTLTPVFVHGAVANVEVTQHTLWAAGSRYAQVPILLLYSLVIVAVDAYLRRGGVPFERAGHGMAVVLLVAVLGITWVSDFRYTDLRSHATPWTHIVKKMDRTCQQDPLGSVATQHDVRIPCSVVKALSTVRPPLTG